jgi:DNA-binding NtrC family response regulator
VVHEYGRRFREEAHGMTFPEEMSREKDLHPSDRAVDERKKTILIYSPDLNFCFSLSILFQDRFSVITTTNAEMLEPFVAHYNADLVIVDAVPSDEMIGKLDALKRLNKSLPIIVLYVYSPKEVQLDRMIRSHVDSVFYKPFDVSAVSKRIEELLPQ